MNRKGCPNEEISLNDGALSNRAEVPQAGWLHRYMVGFI